MDSVSAYYTLLKGQPTGLQKKKKEKKLKYQNYQSFEQSHMYRQRLQLSKTIFAPLAKNICNLVLQLRV